MNEISNDVFSEVYAFFKLLDESYIEKIPEELRNLINEKKNKNYNPKYNADIPVVNQKICKQALSIITAINLEYLADDKEKDEINKILKNNSKIHEKEISKKYSVDNIFKSQNNISEHENKNVNNQALLKEYRKDNLFKKILKKIKSFFSNAN